MKLDISSIFLSAFIGTLGQFWWLYALMLLIPVASLIFRSSWFKGRAGESVVKRYTRKRLDPEIYYAFHDVMLVSEDGTTQIDHIFVSQFGIFVIETKNMQGWIFGSAKQATWTQQIYRSKHKFQNPLRQNYKHVKTLQSLLDVPDVVLNSFVVFVGNSDFKTDMPENVGYIRDMLDYIQTRQLPVIGKKKLQEIVYILETRRLQNTRQSRREHVKNLQARHQNNDSKQQCPRCGATMVLRMAQRGANAGNQFWGCSSYPRCRYTKAHQPDS